MTSIKTILSNSFLYFNQVVTVNGWIRFFRISGGKSDNLDKRIGFIKLNDGSTVKQLQLIFDVVNIEDKTYFDEIFKKGMTGMSIEAIGKIVKSPAAKQDVELLVEQYKILGYVNEPDTYPITKNKLQLDYLRTLPHLRVRTDTFLAVNKIKSVLMNSMYRFFEGNEYLNVQVPLITDNECESGAFPFTVTTLFKSNEINNLPVKEDKKTINFVEDFFKKQTYLTVSGQLHLESIVCGGVSQAWCVTTAFRAEPSTGPKHLAEFWMAELEFCFRDLEYNMFINEECIKYCFSKVLDRCVDELALLEFTYKSEIGKKLLNYITNKFVRTTHEECVRLMLRDIDNKKIKINPNKKAEDSVYIFKEKPGYHEDLSKDHERYITEVLYGGLPVFVKYFPKNVKAFYMPVIDPENEIQHVDCFDLLFPEIGEVVGGSQRISDYDELIVRMKENGINPETLQFYLDLRKYGSIPHGGSGIGIDRLMLMLTGLNNIRDMVPYPRSFGVCNN